MEPHALVSSGFDLAGSRRIEYSPRQVGLVTVTQSTLIPKLLSVSETPSGDYVISSALPLWSENFYWSTQELLKRPRRLRYAATGRGTCIRITNLLPWARRWSRLLPGLCSTTRSCVACQHATTLSYGHRCLPQPAGRRRFTDSDLWSACSIFH